ncbi:MAG: sulfate permease [Gemmatimonadetes bacterium]|nr:sulfate permease [Gemmatimonadota bacterium]MBT5058481.1 sulfate permease [Gemmatimonadota bacterium]MBT5146084.1 sulfate permease [Gemmatimonadota bacterium]MBT5591837.1 sulfate permease [Gemmatimonadota bacterium]MBT5961512.1 sulfate permease [Gemmatimonadota bacterium]
MIQRLFPFLTWLPRLGRDEIRRDLIAGVTVATVLVPQAMAYARLAGLPAVYGLYAAFLPPVVAALWGSSRQLATGPVAMASLISAATVGALSLQTPEAFVHASILLALLVGILRVGLGLLRLGILVNLLSTPVVVGFSNAAALIIAGSQLHSILGVERGHESLFLASLAIEMQRALGGVEWQTLGMATLALAIMLALRQRHERVMIAVAITTVLAWLIGYEGAIVGDIPRGLPSLSIPNIDTVIMWQLLPGAFVLTLIGLMEAMSIARTIATRTKQHIDINQELIGQGMANLVGGVFNSYAVSGSFSRSAINFGAGAASGLSSVVTSAIVMLTLLYLTPLFYYLPQATLAIVIMLAVLSLVRITAVRRAWQVSRADGGIALVTFLVTLALAPQLHWGIVTGVLLSLGHFLRRTMRPHVAYLARHEDGALVDAEAHGLQLDPHIAVIRFDARLYYGAAAFFEDRVLEALVRLPELRHIVLDAGGINRIDATGVETLRRLVEDLRAGGVDIYVTRVKNDVWKVMERDGLAGMIGDDHFFDWNQHALEHLWSGMQPDERSKSPLYGPNPREANAAVDPD